VALFVSCKNEKSDDNNEQLTFYYFPQKNVYYNVQTNNFLYSLDGAKSWDSIANPTGRLPQTLGEKVVIYAPESTIYIDNNEHRQLYGGHLYNIALADSTIRSAALVEVSERPVQKKVTAAKTETKKPKKGIGKLLNNIFGKKEKK